MNFGILFLALFVLGACGQVRGSPSLPPSSSSSFSSSSSSSLSSQPTTHTKCEPMPTEGQYCDDFGNNLPCPQVHYCPGRDEAPIHCSLALEIDNCLSSVFTIRFSFQIERAILFTPMAMDGMRRAISRVSSTTVPSEIRVGVYGTGASPQPIYSKKKEGARTYGGLNTVSDSFECMIYTRSIEGISNKTSGLTLSNISSSLGNYGFPPAIIFLEEIMIYAPNSSSNITKSNDHYYVIDKVSCEQARDNLIIFIICFVSVLLGGVSGFYWNIIVYNYRWRENTVGPALAATTYSEMQSRDRFETVFVHGDIRAPAEHHPDECEK